MIEITDCYGFQVKSGFYRGKENPSNISYFDVENLKILQLGEEFEMTPFLCKGYFPLDPNNYLNEIELNKKFILSKLEDLTVKNKANLSAESLENTSRKVRTDDFSYDDP